MGSRAEASDELTVLVTGYGPFKEDYPLNPSWEIAKGLPEYLPPRRAKDAASRGASSVDSPAVRIVTYPEAVPVSYTKVRELVPKLWDGTAAPEKLNRAPDVLVHIGMASSKPVYQVERRGHRTGYKNTDVDGKYLEDEAEGGHGSDWIWRGLPDELETELDLPAVLERWRADSPADADLQISEDAGRYLCDFIYYSSMAHLWTQQRPRKVVFFHVPASKSEQSIALGRELTINLIRAIAETESQKREQ